MLNILHANCSSSWQHQASGLLVQLHYLPQWGGWRRTTHRAACGLFWEMDKKKGLCKNRIILEDRTFHVICCTAVQVPKQWKWHKQGRQKDLRGLGVTGLKWNWSGCVGVYAATNPRSAAGWSWSRWLSWSLGWARPLANNTMTSVQTAQKTLGSKAIGGLLLRVQIQPHSPANKQLSACTKPGSAETSLQILKAWLQILSEYGNYRHKLSFSAKATHAAKASYWHVFCTEFSPSWKN